MKQTIHFGDPPFMEIPMFVHVQKNNMTIWRKMGGHTWWIFFENEAPDFSLFAVNVYILFWAITRDFGIWNDDNKSVAEKRGWIGCGACKMLWVEKNYVVFTNKHKVRMEMFGKQQLQSKADKLPRNFLCGTCNGYYPSHYCHPNYGLNISQCPSIRWPGCCLKWVFTFLKTCFSAMMDVPSGKLA